MLFLKGIEKNYKTHVYSHKILDPKAVLSEKNSIGGIASPDFKTYYRAIAIKSMVVALKQTCKQID